jgi:hypothetical protein
MQATTSTRRPTGRRPAPCRLRRRLGGSAARRMWRPSDMADALAQRRIARGSRPQSCARRSASARPRSRGPSSSRSPLLGCRTQSRYVRECWLMLRRGAVAGLLTIGALFVAMLVGAGDATAATCSSASGPGGTSSCHWDGPGSDGANAIVSQSRGGAVTAYFNISAGGATHAFWTTVYLQQCDGLGHNCATKAAASDPASGSYKLATFAQATVKISQYSFGHTYRSCGSAKDFTTGWVNLLAVCSPFIYN